MAALDAPTLVLAEAGDNVVLSTDTYGGTTAYFAHTASRRGIDARLVDTLDYDAYEDEIDDDTAFVHVETVGNPSLVTPDFERVADIAHDHGVPLVVDNTFATPALCRPLEHGADAVWESTTKWLHGSGTTVGGVLVDGGDLRLERLPRNRRREPGVPRRELLPRLRGRAAGRRREASVGSKPRQPTVPVRRVADPPRNRNAAASDGPTLRERRHRGGVSSRTTRKWRGSPTPASTTTEPTTTRVGIWTGATAA